MRDEKFVIQHAGFDGNGENLFSLSLDGLTFFDEASIEEIKQHIELYYETI